MAEVKTLPPRSEIPEKFTWNAPSVFPDRKAWGEEIEALLKEIPTFAAYQGRLGESPAVLLEAFKLYEELFQRLVKAYVYAMMSQAVDGTDQEAAQMVGKAGATFGQAGAVVAFFDPELLEVGLETLEKWMDEEPALKVYAHFFDNLFRQQQHVRSIDVEEVLGMVGEVFMSSRQTYEMLVNVDFKFPAATGKSGDPVEVAQGTLEQIYESSDREARRTAYESYTDTHLAYQNVLAANLATTLKSHVFTMRARRYKSTLDMALFTDNIPVEVFHNLIETFKKNLPVWHRYWDVRRRLLGYDEIHPYDIWAPLTTNQPEVSFEQAVEWICEGLAPLGEDYTGTLRRGCLEQRWVDLLPNQGKQQGAFSAGVKGTYPFIKMSFYPNVGSMSTLVHELGHSMHSYLAWADKPIVYMQYTMFAAEIASNFNQAMLRAYLLDKFADDRNFQLALLNEAMDNLHRYFFIMPNLAQWELEMHRLAETGAGLTAGIMNEKMADLFAEGYGSTMTFDRKRVGITWAQFQHMYMNYYVYTYSTGIAGAHAFADRILSGVDGAVEDYLGFLKKGGSTYPLDQVRDAGVDLSTPAPVEAAFKILEGYIDRLESLIE